MPGWTGGETWIQSERGLDLRHARDATAVGAEGGTTARAADPRLRLPVSPLPGPDELCPIELRPIEFLLYALERGVADGAVGAEGDEAPSLGVGCGADDRRVGVLVARGRGGFFGSRGGGDRGGGPVSAVARDVLLGAVQLQFVAVADERGG